MLDSTLIALTFITAAIGAFVGSAAYGAAWQTRSKNVTCPENTGEPEKTVAEKSGGGRKADLRVLRLHNPTDKTLNIFIEPLCDAYDLPPGLTAELRGVDLEFDGGLDIEIGEERPSLSAIIWGGTDVVATVSGEPLTHIYRYPFPLSDAIVELPPVTADLVEAIKASDVSERKVAALRDAYRNLIRPEEHAARAAFLQELLDRWG